MAGLAGAALAAVVAIAGCSTRATVGSPSAGGLNQYFAVGSDRSNNSGPDEFTVSLDGESKYFSLENLTLNQLLSQTPTQGTFTAANGFYDLTALTGQYLVNGVNDSAEGPAVEIPGETAVLVSPPAALNSPSYPVFAVASNQCSSLSGNNTFQFLELPLVAYSGTSPQPIYGSVQGTSTANGDGSVAWKFSNFTTTTAGGVTTTTQTLPGGLCANSPASFGYAIGLSDESADAAVSPSGFFAWWTAVGTLEHLGDGSCCTSQGYVGFVTPSSQMDTSTLVAGKYNGVELNAAGVSGPGSELSRPVAFGATAGSGTMMTGGVFPGDDTTQAPDSSISIDLGAQSATSNGFYPSVTVTIPDIPAPLSGVAIAGSPGSKDAVFVAAQDGLNTLYLFLYQQ